MGFKPEHGDLRGLTADDHTQYLLVDGTRAMTGDLDMGSQSIVTVGTVDGVTVSAHAARHEAGGADEIDVTGLGGVLADPQTPAAHASTHEDGGGDEIDVTGLSGLLADAQTPLGHGATHIRGGSDVLDADRATVTFAPMNYTRDPSPPEAGDVTDLTAHLAGISNALGAALGMTWADVLGNDALSGPAPPTLSTGVALEFQSNNSSDIGTSSVRAREVFTVGLDASGNGVVSGTLTSGDHVPNANGTRPNGGAGARWSTVFTVSLDASGDGLVAGTLTSGHHVPAITATYDLGESTTPLAWRDGHFSRNVSMGGSLYAGGAPGTGWSANADDGCFGNGSGNRGITIWAGDGDTGRVTFRNSSGFDRAGMRYQESTGQLFLVANNNPRVALTGGAFATTANLRLGGDSFGAWSSLVLQDGVTLPSPLTGGTVLAMDSADGHMRRIRASGQTRRMDSVVMAKGYAFINGDTGSVQYYVPWVSRIDIPYTVANIPALTGLLSILAPFNCIPRVTIRPELATDGNWGQMVCRLKRQRSTFTIETVNVNFTGDDQTQSAQFTTVIEEGQLMYISIRPDNTDGPAIVTLELEPV